MTLKEFRKTKRFSWISIGDELGNEVKNPGFVYQDECHIELLVEGEFAGQFFLNIENMDWVSEDIGYLETHLHTWWEWESNNDRS